MKLQRPRSERSTRCVDRQGDACAWALQRADGHFIFELEADATIPAEYVLMRHYRGEPVDAVLEEKIALSPAHSISRRRLAAVSRRQVRH